MVNGINLQSSLQDQKKEDAAQEAKEEVQSSQEDTRAALRAQLVHIFSLEELPKYPQVVAAMNLQFSIHLSNLFYSPYIEAIVGSNYALFLQEVKKLSEEGVIEMAENTARLPLPPMKKTGLGLKSFKGTEEELKTYLKEHDQNAQVSIVKIGEFYNLSFLSETALESYTVWLKEKGHKVQVFTESLAKVYYKIQSQSQANSPKPPTSRAQQGRGRGGVHSAPYYPSQQGNYSQGGYQKQDQEQYQDQNYYQNQGYQQKESQGEYQEKGGEYQGGWQRGRGASWRGHRGGGGPGRGGRYQRGRGGFVKRPRFDSQNFPGLEPTEQSSPEKGSVRRYEITEIFQIFKHTSAGCPNIFDDLRALPQVNNINLFQQKPYDSLALLEQTAQALVKREKLRRMSMNNEDLDDPESYSYLKKATVLTGNHFKVRSRAQSQTFGEGGEPIPKQIQRIIEEQTAELPTEKGEPNRQRLFTTG